jgi:indolepyruvate ferredoxin oxidoreductase
MKFGFALLAPMKFLRGTAFDPFGYLQERKEERETLTLYSNLFVEIAAELTADNYQTAIELAELPMQIRGYGHVKSENLARVNVRKDLLMRQMRGELIPLATEVGVAA